LAEFFAGFNETSYFTGRDVFPRKAYPFLFPIFLAITANAAEQSSDNRKNSKNKYLDTHFLLHFSPLLLYLFPNIFAISKFHLNQVTVYQICY